MESKNPIKKHKADLVQEIGDPTFLNNHEIIALLYTPDAKGIYARTMDTLTLWDRERGTVLRQIKFEGEFQGYDDGFIGLSADASRLATYSLSDCLLNIVDSESFEILYRIEMGPGYYYDIRFLSPTEIILASSLDVRAFSLEGQESRQLWNFKSPLREENSNGVALSPGGDLVAFGDYESNEIVVLELPSGNRLSEFTGNNIHGGGGAVMCFLPDEEALVTIRREEALEVRNYKTGEMIRELKFSSDGDVDSITLAGAHNEYMLVRQYGIDQTIYAGSGKEQKRIYFAEDLTLYAHVALRGDGGEMAISRSNRIYFMDMATKEYGQDYRGLDGVPGDMVYDGKNKLLFVGGSGKGRMAPVFDVSAGAIVDSLPVTKVIAREGRVFCVLEPQRYRQEVHEYKGPGRPSVKIYQGEVGELFFNGAFLIIIEGGADGVKVYSSEGKSICDLLTLDGTPEDIAYLESWRLSADGRYIAAGEGDLKKIIVWDLVSFTCSHVFDYDEEYVTQLALTKDRLFAILDDEEDTSILYDWDLTNKASAPKKAKFKENISPEQLIQFETCAYPALLAYDHKIRFIDPATLLPAAILITPGKISRICSGEPGRFFIVSHDAWIKEYDAGDLTPPAHKKSYSPSVAEEGEIALGGFPDIAAIGDVAETEAALREADWKFFEADQDLPALTNFLSELEKREGIVDLHHFCSRRLMQNGARLRHRYGCQAPLRYTTLSPDGRYLAVGTWCDGDYEEGGVLQIFETRFGNCVNTFSPVEGGVGWPDYGNMVQWSPDSRLLGVGFNTNGVGVFDPFSSQNQPLHENYITDGWSRPPAWTWSEDGKFLSVSCWGGDSPIPGAIVDISRGLSGEQDVRWFDSKYPEESEDIEVSSEDIQPLKWTGWSEGLIYGFNEHDHAFAVEISSGQLVYVRSIDDHRAAYSKDGKRLLVCSGGDLEIRDGRTGHTLLEDSCPEEVEEIHFDPNRDNRIALLVTEEDDDDYKPGVYFYEDTKLIGRIERRPGGIRRDEMTDARSWAWEPEGDRGALLGKGGKVYYYNLANLSPDDSVEVIREIEVSPRAAGILIGAENRLIVIGPSVLQFFDLASGERLNGRSLLLPEGLSWPDADESPLWRGGVNQGAFFQTEPAFPLLDENERVAWAVAFENGLVVCPEKAGRRIRRELALVMDNRYAWPERWVKLEWVSKLKKAKTHELYPEILKGKFGNISREKSSGTESPLFETLVPGEIEILADFTEQIKVDAFEINLRKPNAYEADLIHYKVLLSASRLKELQGGVVLFTEEYSPERTQIGALLAVSHNSVLIYTKEEYGEGVSTIQFENLKWISKAIPRDSGGQD